MTVVYLPDALADDASLPLSVRVLVELQKRGAALDWTPPISATDLAAHFERSRAAVSRALSWAVQRHYLDRQPVSLPRGGRGWRYRARLEGGAELSPHGRNAQ